MAEFWPTFGWWCRQLWWNIVVRPRNNRRLRRYIVQKWTAEGRTPEQIEFASRMGCGWISLDTVKWAHSQADKLFEERKDG